MASRYERDSEDERGSDEEPSELVGRRTSSSEASTSKCGREDGDDMESMEKAARAGLAMMDLQDGLADEQDDFSRSTDDWHEDSFVRHSLEVDDWDVNGKHVRRKRNINGRKVRFTFHG
eukprot:7933953-Pyramimonas_sp.AAC.1